MSNSPTDLGLVDSVIWISSFVIFRLYFVVNFTG